MNTRNAGILAGVAVVAVMTGFVKAQNLPDDQKLIDKAAAKKAVAPVSVQGAAAPPRMVPAPKQAANAAAPDADLAQSEQQARADVVVSQARLDLIVARKSLKSGRNAEAAALAQRVLKSLKTLPAGTDVSVYELQAEGILAKVQRTRGDANSTDAAITAGDMPPPDSNPAQQIRDTAIQDDLDQKVRAAARIARQYDGADTPDIDTSGDVNVLRERTLQNQVPEKPFGYRPSREIINVPAILDYDRERVQFEGALQDAYRVDEARRLTEIDEDRIAPDGVVSYPQNWPQIVAKREKYKDGVIARSPGWTDKDGREWYVAIYDIQDLTYVPPDFPMPLAYGNAAVNLQTVLDRQALRQGSQIFNGYPEDLAAGIPLLRYFGGTDPYATRGPRYSPDRQRQVVDMIERYTNPRGAAPPPNQGQAAQPMQPTQMDPASRP